MLPHVGDVWRPGCFPPSRVEHRLYARGREPTFGFDLGSHGMGALCALALRVFDRVLTCGVRASCRDGGYGERELELSFDFLGDSV